MEAPIPTPRLDDDEDVHWALSTAGALWGRGERVEALKWLRRAAEQASDVNADVRALELFKAAAEVASQVTTASVPPPPQPPKAAAPAPAPATAERLPQGPPKPPAGTTGDTSSSHAARTSVPPPPPPRRAEGSSASKPPPPPLPRPGSIYPTAPAPPAPAAHGAPALRASSPSIPVAPPRLPKPSMPMISQPAAPPPMPDRSKPAAPKPGGPVDNGGSTLRHDGGSATKPPAIMPPVAAPARTVAITTAKASPTAPSSAPRRRRSFTGESRAAVEKSRTAELVHDGGTAAKPHEGSRPPARGHRPRRRTLDEGAAAPQATAAPEPAAIFDEEDTRVLRNKPGGDTDDLVERAFDRLEAGRAHVTPPDAQTAGPTGEVAEDDEEPDEVTIVPRSARAVLAYENGAISTPPEAPVALFTARAPAAPIGAAAPVASIAAEPATKLPEHGAEEPANDGPVSGPASQNTKVWTQLPDMSQEEPSTERPPSAPDLEPPPHAAPQPLKRLDTLQALRVAVLATAVPGDVRLIALDSHDEAPPGAAIAVLVPLSAADGEAVARLFRGLE